LGEEMPRRRNEGNNAVYLVAVLLIGVLLLKGLGILKALFNIDPEGISFSFDIGFLSSAALFALVLDRLHKLSDTISKQGERIARIEGMLESHVKNP
jgi:hypothetical protein